LGQRIYKLETAYITKFPRLKKLLEILNMEHTKPDYFQNPQYDPSPQYYRGNKIGVLLIHGFTATPVEVSLLADYLNNKGYTVSCPLLPGHGTVIEEMHQVKWGDWANHVENSFGELRSSCDTVFVGGESLGSLLTMYLAIQHPEMRGVLLNAPALYAKNSLVYLAPIMQYFIKTMDKKQTRTTKNIVDERWQGYNIYSIPAAAQVLYFQHYIRRLLTKIEQPVIIFQGELDQSIQPEGAQVIFDQISSSDKELIWLEKSTHCVLLDQEWESIAEKSAAFIERLL
jgi:carboxylesterase